MDITSLTGNGAANSRAGNRGIPEATLPLRDAVGYWAKMQPSKTAFVDVSGAYSYARIASDIELMVASFLEFGIHRGDRIVTIVPNEVEFAVLLFAAMKIEANLVPLDTNLTEDEIGNRLEFTHPQIVLTHRQDVAAKSEALGYPTFVLDENRNLAEGARLALLQPREAVGAVSVCDVATESPALTIFTSGTTGKPKGVLLSEVNLSHAVTSIRRALDCNRDDVFLTALPISHIFGVNTGILLPMLVGGTSVLMPRFNADESLDIIDRMHVSVYNGVPSTFKRMASAQIRSPRNVSSMRTGCIAGAECTNLEDYHRILHCNARVIYGFTESPIITYTQEGDSLDTDICGVGRFNEALEARIVDGDGKPKAVGSPGEIIIKSRGTMLGYLDDPEATRKCIDARGWIHAEDLGYVDSDGYVHIIGRKNDLINRGGYKVYPAEVEDIYKDNPDVLDCCALGLPHSELGQQIVVFVELRQGCASPQALRDYAKGRIAKYKVPDQVVIVERIPRLPNEKPDKKALIRLYEESGEGFRNDAELQAKLKLQREGKAR